MNAVAEQKVFVVDIDEVEKQRKPITDPAPVKPGIHNAQDFISVPFPAGYTHIEVISKDTRRCIKPQPIGEDVQKTGGFYLVLTLTALERIYTNPDQYKWDESLPFPQSNVPVDEV